MVTRLRCFAAEQKLRGAVARTDRGVRTVEVARIVGSVGRPDELDHRFRPRRGLRFLPRADARTDRVRRLFERGVVPPVDLYQIGDDYFVVDGHHRVRVALERGQEFLDAHVVEYLLDRKDPANQLHYERRGFAQRTGLDDVVATETGRYPRLESRVRDHGRELALRGRRPGVGDLFGQAALTQPLPPLAAVPTLRAAARDWYEREYRPVVEVLVAERIVDRFPGRGLGDLYGYVCDHRWYLSERRGWDVGIDEALVDFVQRNGPAPLGEALVDPVVALGSELLDGGWARRPGGPRQLAAHAGLSFAVGLVALPLAFLRGLRPRHYRFPRRGRAEVEQLLGAGA